MHHEVLILIGDIIIAQSAKSPRLISVHGMHLDYFDNITLIFSTYSGCHS
jgi:hypothetical protein